MEKFHKNFGFTQGLNANVLADQSYEFARALYHGLNVPLEGRLFVHMNPSQILGVLAGFYVTAINGVKTADRNPDMLYWDLLKKGEDAYADQLESIDKIASKHRLNPFDRSDLYLNARLFRIVERYPDMFERFAKSKLILRNLIDNRLRFQSDPNGDDRSELKRNKLLYIKPVISAISYEYETFLNQPYAADEISRAQKEMFKPRREVSLVRTYNKLYSMFRHSHS